MKIGAALRHNIEADELTDLVNHDFNEASQDKLKLTDEQLADPRLAEAAQQEFDQQ